MNWLAFWVTLTFSLPQPVCHNTAIMAAQVLEENQIPHKIVWDGKHMQTKALINGQWVWIDVEASMKIGRQEQAFEGKVFEADWNKYLRDNLKGES